MAGSDKVGQPGSNGSLGDSGVSRNETTDGFHYDALDNLIGRTTSAGREQRFYRSDELANETNGNINSTFIRAEGVVLAEHRTGSGSEVMLLAGDDKNSVLSEISQGAVKSIAYSAYGHRTQSASVNCHLGYNGERRETQTGWYLLGNGYRVFNPLLMRFHSPDNLSPFGKGGLNAYIYCVGDPINSVDPTGHSPWGWLLRGFRNTIGSPRVTTATPGYEKLPKILSRNSKSHPTTLYPIEKKHISRLRKRALLFWDDAEKAGQRNALDFETLKDDAILATTAHEYAKKNEGKIGITREGAATIKRVAEDYDSRMAIRALANKGRVRANLEVQIKEVRAARPREPNVRKRHLGYQPDGD